MVIAVYQTKPQHEFQAPNDHLQEEDQTKQLFNQFFFTFLMKCVVFILCLLFV